MSEQRVVVMGLGNLLWADEVSACGWRNGCMPITTGPSMGDCRWRYSGTELAGVCRKRHHLLILDAIDYGLEPGTLRTLPENVFRLISARRK